MAHVIELWTGSPASKVQENELKKLSKLEDRLKEKIIGPVSYTHLVGTLLRVAQGKIEPGDIPGIIERRDRRYAGPTAQACGLYLNRVFYKGIDEWEERNSDTMMQNLKSAENPGRLI